MQRRKFIIGMGALASGTAAAVGSGAFSSVEADRDVTVSVEEDADAFLGMEPADDATFATDNEGVLELNFDDSTSADGEGLNANADTGFGPEIKFTNQGTDDVLVTMDMSDVDADLSGDGSLSFFIYSAGREDDKEATLKQSEPTEGGNQGVILEPGAEVEVAGLFRDIDPGDINGDGDLEAEITVYAVSDNSEKWPDAGPSTAGDVPTISDNGE